MSSRLEGLDYKGCLKLRNLKHATYGMIELGTGENDSVVDLYADWGKQWFGNNYENKEINSHMVQCSWYDLNEMINDMVS